MRIIQANFDSVVEQFGASRRLATRLGALARAGLLVTETVLEVAASDDGKPLQSLLLSKSLLDAAGTLDSTALAALATDSWFAETPLAIAVVGTSRVLCLAEESDAEPATSNSGALIAQQPAGAVIPRDEARRLLAGDEVPRLKLDLVTSSDPGKRLEALRKLYLSELPQDEKLRLFLLGLRDREGDVRAESAKALGGLGLDAGLTENLARAARGTTPERVVAVSNLTRMFARLDDAQRQLAVAMLTEFIEPAEPVELVQAALGALSQHAGTLSDSPLLHLHRQLVSLLQVKLSHFEEPARKVYGVLFERDRAMFSRLLSETVEQVGQIELRFFALSLITQHDLPAAGAPAVIEQLIEGLVAGSELDRNYQACAGALTRLGELAVGGLLAALDNATDSGKRKIVDLLGHMLRGTHGQSEHPLSDETARRVAQACLALYPNAKPEVCTALLESGFYSHAAVDDALRAQAAQAFLDSLHDFRFERQIELVQEALFRCGHAALPPLRSAIRESAYDVTRISASRILPEVIERAGETPAEVLHEISAELRAILDDEDSSFPQRGPLYVALGRIGAHQNADAALALELSQYLREKLGKTSDVYDVLESIGYIAAGANLEANERLECGYLLLQVLTRGLPGLSGRMRKNEEGELVLHFGRETTAYTDMIPRILDGLGRMIESPRTPEPLFDRIAAEMLRLWTEIVDFKRVWAPAATMTLARWLGRIAMGGRRSDRMADDIAEVLARKLILLPVMQVLSALVIARQDSERMDLLSARVFAELTKRLNEQPGPEPTERKQILETMAAIARRPRLGDREKDIEHARNVVVEALFEAVRDKMMFARPLLDEFAGTPGLAENLRNDIRRRLKPAR